MDVDAAGGGEKRPADGSPDRKGAKQTKRRRGQDLAQAFSANAPAVAVQRNEARTLRSTTRLEQVPQLPAALRNTSNPSSSRRSTPAAGPSSSSRAQ
jgi:hypothetical protein